MERSGVSVRCDTRRRWDLRVSSGLSVGVAILSISHASKRALVKHLAPPGFSFIFRTARCQARLLAHERDCKALLRERLHFPSNKDPAFLPRLRRPLRPIDSPCSASADFVAVLCQFFALPYRAGRVLPQLEIEKAFVR